MEVEGGNRENGISEKHNDRGTPTETGSSATGDAVDKPYVGLVFESEEAAKKDYDAYARRLGFSIHVSQFNRSKPDGPIISWDYACSRETIKRKNIESCNAMIRIESEARDKWVVTKFVEDHNHSLASSNKTQHLRPHRHFAGSTKNLPELQNATNGVYVSVEGNNVSCETNRVVRSTSIETNRPTRDVQPMNYFNTSSRKRSLGKDAQNLLEYFKKMQAQNAGFYYAIQLDDENRMTNVFWADARSRMKYNYFGDAVIFDTMYRPNQYQVPFAPFTGVNHHGHVVLFGCALIFDESESSFKWLFKTFLSAMNDRPPVSICTDQDRAIQAAVAQVLPDTRHCICKWHILRESQERLALIYQTQPSFYGELYTCIIYSETIEDFEAAWCSFLDKYDLRNNEWLQAVYNARKQWAPVYFRRTFFAAIFPNQGYSSFFNGYVNQHTTIPLFFKQYERALEYSLEREIKSDFDTMRATPILNTPSPMEQQAANLYTNKVFAKFQEELVETFAYTANMVEDDGMLSTYTVAKYDNNDRTYTVTLNISEVKADCSCHMFEYCGILCRHILTVFTVTNVLTLPPHYILKRWTTKAKSGVEPDDHSLEPQNFETLTMRFNSLCQIFIKHAEEGAVTAETYKTALDAFREAGRKIAAAKKNSPRIISHSSQGSVLSQEDSNRNTLPSLFDMAPSLWPWQDAVPPHFDLNDAGVPVTDLNQPSMAPVSIHREGASLDNMAVLTCFKSMKWVIENKNSTSAGKVAVINLKLQDYGKSPSEETQVQFRLTKITLEPMIKSMAHISQQLSVPANKVAVINLKLQDTNKTSGQTELRFQVSRDTLGSMLRSMACIREQL